MNPNWGGQNQTMDFFQFLFSVFIILVYCGLTTAQLQPIHFCQGANYTNNSPYRVNLNLLLSSLSSNATHSNQFYNTTIGQNPPDKAYGLYFCRGDATAEDCKNCVATASKDIIQRCPTNKEAIIWYDMCTLRYSNESISLSDETMGSSAPTAQLPPAPLTNPTIPVRQENGKNSSSRIIVMVVFPSLIALILLSIIAIWFHSRRRRIEKQVDTLGKDGEEITNVESLQFDFDTIEAATDNFSDANKLGKGGFGVVYKGNLSNGQEIAVKRLSRNSGQGEEQFKNEVLLVAKLQHRNLVKLLGFCIEGEEKLLIYEFVPNTSLDHFIFDPIKHSSLNWETRYKIIGGIARGLLYLHEDSRHRIIHRDLKLGNILLDEEMNPKISDFGMARLFVVNQSEGNTNRIVGTYGYMSPEYAMHGQFSVKSDVYSFGVLLLEVVSGKKINSFYDPERFENLLSYAWRHWKEGTALELIDPILRDNFLISEVVRCIHIGLLCVQENLADRPTMATVVLMLSSYSGSLSLPSPPAFCFHGMNSNTPMSNLKPWSVNEVSNTEIYPR